MAHNCQKTEDKDIVIFASRKDHAGKSKIELPKLEPPPGVILPNGEINWLCPCLGGLATGPCGIPFRNAFTCFHLSRADPKGSDCVTAFKSMQECIAGFPKIYRNDNIPISYLTEEEEKASKVRSCKAETEVKVPKFDYFKMSYCRQDGKDIIIFATKEDHATRSTVSLPEIEPGPGLILPNGDINWNCPCLGGMSTGPCGVQFRKAFSCFHYSTADPKGSDCYQSFSTMQNCMQQYPTIYEKTRGKDDDELDLGTALDDTVSKNDSQKNTLAAEQSEKIEAKA